MVGLYQTRSSVNVRIGQQVEQLGWIMKIMFLFILCILTPCCHSLSVDRVAHLERTDQDEKAIGALVREDRHTH